MTETAEFDASLELIRAAAANFHEDWWVIGSAAAAIAGANVGEIRDIDLLLSESDARRLVNAGTFGLPLPAAPSSQFRSAIFARFEETPLPIEIMAGFEMKMGDLWRAVLPATRQERHGVFVPIIAEQIELLLAMGRTKDEARINALRAI